MWEASAALLSQRRRLSGGQSMHNNSFSGRVLTSHEVKRGSTKALSLPCQRMARSADLHSAASWSINASHGRHSMPGSGRFRSAGDDRQAQRRSSRNCTAPTVPCCLRRARSALGAECRSWAGTACSPLRSSNTAVGGRSTQARTSASEGPPPSYRGQPRMRRTTRSLVAPRILSAAACLRVHASVP